MNNKERRNKFYWVLYGYLVFLGVFLIYYQVRIHKLENKLEESNSELRYDGDEVFKDIGDKFYFYDVEMGKLKERISDLENELENQQEHSMELLEDYYALVAEKAILEEKLKQEKEKAKEIYTEEDIQYAIDIFATYLVEYPPNGSICVYQDGTLFLFKMVNDTLVLDEILSYNDLKELWFNK